MSEHTDLTDVYAAFGRAAYYAQLLEYQLVSIWMLDAITQGVAVTRDDLIAFQGQWTKKTLGRLLHPLKNSSLIPEDLKEFLETVRLTRNCLAHNFFLSDDADLRTSESRKRAIEKLAEMDSILGKGEQLFASVLSTYSADFGIDYDAIMQEVLNESKVDAEHATADAERQDVMKQMIKKISKETQLKTAILEKRKRECSQTKNTHLYVVTENDIEIAFLALDHRKDLLKLVLYEIFIDNKFRHKGYGTAIIKQLEQMAYQSSYSSVVIRPGQIDSEWDLPKLIGLYTKLGYHETQSGEMEKEINS